MKAKNRGIRSEESRQRLIDGAVESILKVGYARTTIGELVKQAGLSKGAHVYHFKSKLDLMRQTIAKLFERVDTRFDTSKAERPTSLEDIERMPQALAEITLDNEGSALLEVWMASRTDADIRRVFARLEGDNERVHYESMVSYVWPKSRRIDRGAVSDGWRGLPAPRPRLAAHTAEEHDAG